MSISARETVVRCVPAPFQQECAAGRLDTAPPPGLQHWWQQTAENKRQRCSHAEHDSNFGEINSRFYHRVRSKLKVQNSSTFQRPKLHFSSTKIIDKKPYPSRGHSKFRLQCDTEVYCTHQYCNDKSKWQIAVINLFVIIHTSACFKIVNKCKISKFARFKFKEFSRILKHLICFKHFQGPWSFYSKFKHFQGFLKHAMNPVIS